MSDQDAKLFWETANTQLVAQILKSGKSGDSRSVHKLAVKAGYNVTAEELEKNSPNRQGSKRVLASPRHNDSSSSQNHSSQTQSSQTQSSQTQSSQNHSSQTKCKGKGILRGGSERGFTFSSRPLL